MNSTNDDLHFLAKASLTGLAAIFALVLSTRDVLPMSEARIAPVDDLWRVCLPELGRN